jgi:hypothetical protein
MPGPQGPVWDTIQFGFAGGLQTKTHPHAIAPPQLTVAKNCEFDESGAVRLRHPYASVGLDILGGGTIAGADLRKVVAFGDEELLFTKDALYSRSDTLSKWALRGTHLAVKVEEATRFANPNDQVFADRAQLSGVIVYVWTEVLATTTLCYLAAIDATTSATVIAPTSFGAGADRPRVVALTSKIMVFWVDATGLKCKDINPASPSFTASGATSVTSKDAHYDVMKDPAADTAVVAVRNGIGTEYDLARVTALLTVSTVTKVRSCNGVIALACSAGGTTLVARQATTDIKGDLVTTSSLADTASVNVTIGTAATSTINQLTCAFRSTQTGGQYRAYVYWSVDEDAVSGIAPDFVLKHNWIDTGATLGTEAVLFYRQGIAARAFSHDGYVYLWSVFAQQSTGGSTIVGIEAPYQNTYFLHRDDGSAALVSKAAWLRAGGFAYYGGAGLLRGHLPGVALVDGTTGYAWCGIERQTINTLQKIGRTYGARAPRDVVFTFDSDDARRVAHLGRTLYVSGGMLMQYDGEGLVEVGFQVFPWNFGINDDGGAGTVPAGAYSGKATIRWDNAVGEVDRSTTAVGGQDTLAGPQWVGFDTSPINITRKQGSRRSPAIEFWRTKVNPPNGAPYYLVTSKDPAVTGVNGYVVNDAAAQVLAAAFDDNYSDAELITKEQYPENNGTLPRFAPPGASIVLASDARLFLAGIPGEPTRVWYSLFRNEGEIAAFNSLLSFELPAATGAITALALWQETLVVFTASAVYAVPGDGYNNVGAGSGNYGPARVISSDLGAISHDTVAVSPGGLVFFSRKGWYRLTGGWGLEYIGAPVEDFNSDTWVGAQVVESQHQVRLLSTTRMLVWDYLAPSPDGLGAWAEWTQASGRGLAMWSGTPVIVDTAVRKETPASFAAVDYDFEVELRISFAGLLGFSLLKRFTVMGEYKAAHAQRIRVAFDQQAAFTDDVSTILTGLTVGNATRVQRGPSQKRVGAVRVRVTVRATNGTTPAYDAVTLTGIAFELGFQRGLYPRIAATHKQ